MYITDVAWWCRSGNMTGSSLPDALDLKSLAAAYACGASTPSQLLQALYPRLAATRGMFIYLAPLQQLLARAAELEAQPVSQRGSLWGVPFATKDNVDVAGMPTTAGCAAFQYMPEETAPAVQALLDAGAMNVGKTNLDQFASGLVGTRTPYGVAANSFDNRFIPGGSSSGSGPAVGSRLLSFALGTDTAGSGRVPAGYNGCVGIKGTVGKVSTVGKSSATGALPAPLQWQQSGLDVMTALLTAGYVQFFDAVAPWHIMVAAVAAVI
eukprot:GHUV01019081.1.p1 GENE.GHUV01019081.1~~GHUV01019081.1.p1  ORF type:complete len:267 (+),score=71.59 GHUV01019081.1:702-1502(+)